MAVVVRVEVGGWSVCSSGHGGLEAEGSVRESRARAHIIDFVHTHTLTPAKELSVL